MAHTYTLVKARASDVDAGQCNVDGYFEDTAGDGKMFDYICGVQHITLEEAKEEYNCNSYEELEEHFKNATYANLNNSKVAINSALERTLKALFMPLDEAPTRVNDGDYILKNRAKELLGGTAQPNEGLPKNLEELQGLILELLSTYPGNFGYHLKNMEESHNGLSENMDVWEAARSYYCSFVDMSNEGAESDEIFYYIVDRHC